MNISPEPIVTIQEALECSKLMTLLEPEKSEEECFKLFTDRSKDIFIIKENGMVAAYCVLEKSDLTSTTYMTTGSDPNYKKLEIIFKDWLDKRAQTQIDETGV